jgi:hypothetical protein
MTDRTGLARATATGDPDSDVQLIDQFRDVQRLAHNHPRGLTTEVLIEGTLVYDNIARATSEVYPRYRRFASARSVMNLSCFCQCSDLVCLGGLGVPLKL